MTATDARYAAALSLHPVPAHAVGEVAGELLEQLDGEPPDLVVCFASPHLVGALDDMTRALRRLVEPDVLIGMATAAVIGGTHEAERTPAFSAWAGRFGGGVTPVGLHVVDTPDGPAISGWPTTDPDPDASVAADAPVADDAPGHADAHTLLLLVDPFTFPIEAFLSRLEQDRPDLQVIGGMASAAQGPGGNRLALDAELHREGAVGVLLSGPPVVRALASQGCRPVGSAFIVTGADGHVIRELAGKPALERLTEVANALPDEERQLLAQGLQVGLVVDEHQAEFGRGDFLVRSVLGANRDDGSISVGTEVTVGQTLQFHVRDAVAADEDLREILAGAETGARADAALLFTCTARGEQLFGFPNHDAELVDELLGPLPLAGAFCAGEIGPVGGRNHVHAFTASVALFGG